MGTLIPTGRLAIEPAAGAHIRQRPRRACGEVLSQVRGDHHQVAGALTDPRPMRLLAWRIGRQPGRRRAGRHRWHRASSRANCPPATTRPCCAWSRSRPWWHCSPAPTTASCKPASPSSTTPPPPPYAPQTVPTRPPSTTSPAAQESPPDHPNLTRSHRLAGPTSASSADAGWISSAGRGGKLVAGAGWQRVRAGLAGRA